MKDKQFREIPKNTKVENTPKRLNKISVLFHDPVPRSDSGITFNFTYAINKKPTILFL
jgi:hypothetical protein